MSASQLALIAVSLTMRPGSDMELALYDAVNGAGCTGHLSPEQKAELYASAADWLHDNITSGKPRVQDYIAAITHSKTRHGIPL